MPPRPLDQKSSPDRIRDRFDSDVERFSNLDTGQATTIDASLAIELVAGAAAAATPHATELLDIGCGAGNYTLTMLERLPGLNVTLVDLSKPMLARSVERIGRASGKTITPLQKDIRDLELEPESFDIILAAAVLHHLRDDAEWEAVFRNLYTSLRPGGSLWIFDMVEHSTNAVQRFMWSRYGKYLVGLKNEAFRDHVFGYIEAEDSPRPLLYQVDLLRRVGFETVDILHKSNCFAAFGAVRS
jgi:tRNA (cmo5U34)-methyltransferase